MAELIYIFSLPVRSGWNPAPNSKSADTLPSMLIFPEFGWIIFEISFKRVLLPEPLGPIIPKVSPCLIEKDTSSKARNSS